MECHLQFHLKKPKVHLFKMQIQLYNLQNCEGNAKNETMIILKVNSFNDSSISQFSVKNYISDAPRNVTIRSYGDIDDLPEGPGYIEISCNADCNPECNRYKIYHNGEIINTSKDTRIRKDRKNSGRYQCAATNSISDRFQNSTNNVDIDIKCESM